MIIQITLSYDLLTCKIHRLCESFVYPLCDFVVKKNLTTKGLKGHH
jgi:hypothetical protein